jgi:hypothetical protein
MESCPEISIVVPTTSTVFMAVIDPQVAVIVIVRFALFPNVLRAAVAIPEASVVPGLPEMVPEVAEKFTV